MLRHVHARPAGDIVATNLLACTGDYAREACGDGRVHAQAFLQRGEEEGQVVDGLHGDFRAGSEGGAYLGNKASVGGGIGEQEVGGARERGGGSFTARDEEDSSVCVHLAAGQGAVLLPLVLQDEREEIRLARLRGQPRSDAVLRHGEEIPPRADDGLVVCEEALDAVPVPEERVFGPDGKGRYCLDVLEDHVHPDVVPAVAQAIQRLAKGQVCDDVEGRVVVPAHNVSLFAFLCE